MALTLPCRSGGQLTLLPEELALIVLKAHVDRQEAAHEVGGFVLRPQLDYTGLMATGAYKGWKKRNNKGRTRAGCFDFKILRLQNGEEVDMVHTDLIRRTGELVETQHLEAVFSGSDPTKVLSGNELVVLQEIQLAMLEQEVNWGDEDFQSWTKFPPSKRRRPRDFVMAYLRRILVEPAFLDSVERRKAASGTFGVLPPPLEKEWRPYRETTTSEHRPWLSGEILDRFRRVAYSLGENPVHATTYS